jgi:hypothetical protein
MQYWIVKGNPREYNLDEMVVRGQRDEWRTKKPPRLWRPRDRIFFWSSSPRRELVALGTFIGETGEYTEDGETIYTIRYLTGPMDAKVSATELRADTICAGANFLKPAVAQGVLQVTEAEAHQMYRLMRRANGGRPNCWHDIPSPDGVFPPDLDIGATEGDQRLRLHYSRERSRALVEKKKTQVFNTTGALACDVCEFDFSSRYGRLGSGFCEVHHVRALSTLTGASLTTLDDLAVVCSNCHRMLHRRTPMLSIAQLKKMLRD